VGGAASGSLVSVGAVFIVPVPPSLRGGKFPLFPNGGCSPAPFAPRRVFPNRVLGGWAGGVRHEKPQRPEEILRAVAHVGVKTRAARGRVV